MPEVSVCIPTYNRADVIADSLRTILDQTYTDFELVVVDNASTDSTEAVVRSFSDPRLRYVRNRVNVGQIGNQNRCVEEASGSLVAIFHDHDLYHPDILRRSLTLLDRYPNVGVVCSAVHWIDAHTVKRISTEVQPWAEVNPGHEMIRRLLASWNSRIMSPTTVVRRKCYEAVGPWRTKYIAGDRDIWMRILRHWDLAYIREPMASLRTDPEPNRVDAKRIWTAQLGHSEMHREILKDLQGDRRFSRSTELLRWELVRRAEFWKTGLWALKKKHREVAAMGPEAFRQDGLGGSAALYAWLSRMLLPPLQSARRPASAND